MRSGRPGATALATVRAAITGGQVDEPFVDIDILHCVKTTHSMAAHDRENGFTLIELMVVVAIIAVLAGVVLPVFSATKRRAARANCIHNLQQINMAVLMYADEHRDVLPSLPVPNPFSNGVYFFYKELVKDYLGLKRASSPEDRVFACPADQPSAFVPQISAMALNDYSRYLFNGGNVLSNGFPGLAGRRVKEISETARTLLVAEHPSFVGYSWHRPQSRDVVLANGWHVYNNAMNEVSFVDGHVTFIPMYNNGVGLSAEYDPIAGYEYRWSCWR